MLALLGTVWGPGKLQQLNLGTLRSTATYLAYIGAYLCLSVTWRRDSIGTSKSTL